jgi:coproporphyrinogen III oxidase-like Fe-S oxidoreductase
MFQVQNVDQPHQGLAARFGINAVSYYGETLARLLKQQLLEISGGQLRLTGQGLLLADSVMAELV